MGSEPMSYCQAVMHEILWHEKQYGRKPKLLILAEKDFRDQFFSELHEFTMKTDNLDFKTPGQFYGVPFVWQRISQYGGGCRWMLVGWDE
jgi:hypothetical protein